jgi:mycothiol synthase
MKAPTTPLGLEVNWAPATPADALELSELVNRCAAKDDTPDRVGVAAMQHRLEVLLQPLATRTIVGRAEDGAAIAYGTVAIREHEDRAERSFVAAYVDPAWRNLGIEDSVTDWIVAAAVRTMMRSRAEHRYVCARLFATQDDAADRFLNRGFELVRHWWDMERSLSEPFPDPPEKGFRVQPWEDQHSAATRPVNNAAFADHWGATQWSRASWRKHMVGRPGTRLDLSFVATVRGDVVGFALNAVHPEDWQASGRSEGWIGVLGVLPEWRRRGIATALLVRSMTAMRAAGLGAAVIGVDAENQSRAQHLYAAVGFATRSTRTTWQREVQS